MSSHIIVRNRTFRTSKDGARQSTNADPIALAFYASLSATFPLGEAFFVRSVVQFAKKVSPSLKTEVEAFARQEAHHSREHAHFNSSIEAAGLPVKAITAHACAEIVKLERRAPLNRLAATVALEHFTAVFARELLSDPRHLAYCDPVSRDLWHWHAVEEIEHKAVAIDVFNEMTAGWSSTRRWLCLTGAMIDAILTLALVVWAGVSAIVVHGGHNKTGWQFDFLKFLFVKPGLIGKMSGPIASFFVPGFHPNQSDESSLLVTARAAL